MKSADDPWRTKAGDDLQRWLASADFDRPIQWGAIEAEVLARPTPTEAELAEQPELPGVRWAVAIPLAVILCSTPLVTLVAAVFAVRATDGATATGWLRVTQIASLGACVVALTPVLIWWETRKRGRWELVATLGAGLAALAAFLVLQREAVVPLGWTPWMVGGVATIGLVAGAILLVASKPGRRLPRARNKDLTPVQRWQRGARAAAIEELLKRGVVDRQEIDVTGMVEMPLGTWHELDSPDLRRR